MAETISLTKSIGGDYEIVVNGSYSYTKQFPDFKYTVDSAGVKLIPRAKKDILMFKYYAPSEWTINDTSGFTTIKEVTDAITVLQGSVLNLTPEYKAVYDAMVIKPSAELSVVYNDFVKTLKTSGIWDNSDLINIKVTESNSNGEALINWKTASVSLQLGGASLPTFKQFSGITGTATGYIRTGIIPNIAINYSQNNASIWQYKKSLGIQGKCELGAWNGSTGITMVTHNFGTMVSNRINNSGTVADSADSISHVGLFILNRTSSANFDIWREKVKVVSKSVASQALIDKEIWELCFNNSGTAAENTTSEVSIIGISKSLSDSQISILSDACDLLMSRVNSSLQYNELNWKNSVQLADYTTHRAITPFSEYEFSFSGTTLYVTANPTLYASKSGYCYATFYVDGVFYQRLAFTSNTTNKIQFTKGIKTIKIISGMVQDAPFIGTFITSIRAFSTMTNIPETSVSEKTVFIDDSVLLGWGTTNPEVEGAANLFKVENSKNIAHYGWAGASLFELAGDSTKINAAISALTILFQSTTSKKVVISVGTNDYDSSTTAANFETYYTNLVNAINALDNSIHIYCISPFRRTGDPSLLADYRTKISSICGTRAYTTYIDGYAILALTDLVDGIHATVLGNKKIKDAIYTTINP